MTDYNAAPLVQETHWSTQLWKGYTKLLAILYKPLKSNKWIWKMRTLRKEIFHLLPLSQFNWCSSAFHLSQCKSKILFFFLRKDIYIRIMIKFVR